jgi:hypothetical protein
MEGAGKDWKGLDRWACRYIKWPGKGQRESDTLTPTIDSQSELYNRAAEFVLPGVFSIVLSSCPMWQPSDTDPV